MGQGRAGLEGGTAAAGSGKAQVVAVQAEGLVYDVSDGLDPEVWGDRWMRKLSLNSPRAAPQRPKVNCSGTIIQPKSFFSLVGGARQAAHSLEMGQDVPLLKS